MNEATEDAFALRDPVPAEPLLPDPGLPSWAWWAAAGALLLVLALVFLLGRRKKGVVDPVKVREEAYRQAAADLAAPAAGSIQEAATKVSLVLRRYLAVVAADPALFETHEEFVSRHESLASYPADLRESTAGVFARLARLKYGREAAGEPAALFAGARELLDRLHQHQPA